MTMNDWLCNIENSAAVVASALGQETVNFILQNYHAHSIEDLDPSDYPEVFSELYAYEADLNN